MMQINFKVVCGFFPQGVRCGRRGPKQEARWAEFFHRNMICAFGTAGLFQQDLFLSENAK